MLLTLEGPEPGRVTVCSRCMFWGCWLLSDVIHFMPFFVVCAWSQSSSRLGPKPLHAAASQLSAACSVVNLYLGVLPMAMCCQLSHLIHPMPFLNMLPQESGQDYMCSPESRAQARANLCCCPPDRWVHAGSFFPAQCCDGYKYVVLFAIVSNSPLTFPCFKHAHLGSRLGPEPPCAAARQTE